MIYAFDDIRLSFITVLGEEIETMVTVTTECLIRILGEVSFLQV